MAIKKRIAPSKGPQLSDIPLTYVKVPVKALVVHIRYYPHKKQWEYQAMFKHRWFKGLGFTQQEAADDCMRDILNDPDQLAYNRLQSSKPKKLKRLC